MIVVYKYLQEKKQNEYGYTNTVVYLTMIALQMAVCGENKQGDIFVCLWKNILIKAKIKIETIQVVYLHTE